MEVLFYLLLVFAFIVIVFLSVDAYYWWMERYPRYKIGRWKENESWMSHAFAVGLGWLPKVPAVPVTQNKYLLLMDILKGKFTNPWVQAWQTGGLLIGVSEYSAKDSERVRNNSIQYFINEEGKWKVKPKNVDFAILAYGLLKYNDRKDFLKPAMDELIAVIEKQIGEDGLIAYSSRKNIRYIDTLGLVCPFLVLYDKTYRTDKYEKLAVLQIEQFIERGMFPNTWLPIHSYEWKTCLPVGVYGWGRGTGWFILGLLDSFLELSEEDHIEKLRKSLLTAADYYLQFQREDGGFGIFLQNKETYDSSATAIFAYFYGKCYELTQDRKYLTSMEKSLTKLKAYTRRNGALDYCQGDTVDVGIFSQRMDIMPFAQGMLLRAMVIYSRIKHSI